jgi:hypothetical protein
MLKKEWWWYHTFRDDDTLEVWDEAVKAARTPQERRQIEMEIDEYYLLLKSNMGENIDSDVKQFNRLYYKKGKPDEYGDCSIGDKVARIFEEEVAEADAQMEQAERERQEREAVEDEAGLQLQWDLMKGRVTS